MYWNVYYNMYCSMNCVLLCTVMCTITCTIISTSVCTVYCNVLYTIICTVEVWLWNKACSWGMWWNRSILKASEEQTVWSGATLSTGSQSGLRASPTMCSKSSPGNGGNVEVDTQNICYRPTVQLQRLVWNKKICHQQRYSWHAATGQPWHH